MLAHKEESLAAIVGFAQSQHERGVPFEQLTIRMDDLPEGDGGDVEAMGPHGELRGVALRRARCVFGKGYNPPGR
jgi:hypothetical protein